MEKAYILSGIGNTLSVGKVEVCLEFRTCKAVQGNRHVSQRTRSIRLECIRTWSI